MCGIGGILKVHDPADGPPPHPLEAIPERWLDTLDDAILHRGPDGQGRFRDRAVRPDGTVVDVAFVHRRLSIIDHAGGHQPMVHDGQRLRPDLTYARGQTPRLAHELCPASEHPDLVAVVFNGCIYNHRELRSELEGLGHRFETDHSDTEVLVHGWRAWGRSVLARLSSMHATGVWARSPGLVCASRDRFGEKPLYLAGDAGVGLFASTAGGAISLCPRASIPLVADRAALVEWIAMGQHPTATPMLGVEQETPGGWRCDPGGDRGAFPPASALGAVPEHRSFRLSRQVQGPKAAADAVESALARAVGSRLEADVPMVCYLSGGLDSSLVSLFAHRALQERGGRLRTLCVRMLDARYDESAAARAVAEVIGTEHDEVDPSADAASDLVRLIQTMGLPFGDSSLLPAHWVSRAACEIAGVALGGDGGDELFLGYERQMVAGDLVPLAFVSALASGMAAPAFPRRDPHGAWDKAARMLVASSKRSYRSLLAIHQHPELARLLGGSARLCRWDDRVNEAAAARAYDLDRYLPGDLLRKVDAASMACPIEVRSPMLDAELCGLTNSLGVTTLRDAAQGVLVSHAARKGLLKRIARRHFPRNIVDRPKQGFAIPIGEWFRTDYGGMRQLLHDHLESADPFPGLAEAGVEINMSFVRLMLREHDAAGERSLNPWHGRDHSQRLYMLLVLSIWAKWLEGVRRSDPA